MKKFLAIVLAVVMVFSFAACGEKKQEEVAAPKVLRVATKGNPIGMSPLTVAVSSSNTPVQQFLYDRLFEFDADKNDIVPMLATAYEYVDATHIRLTIRDDVYAYDGTTKFTAEDVAFSLKLACDTGNAANYFNKYFNPAGFKVEDATHVVLELVGPDPFVITALSNIPYGMICGKNFTTVEDLANDKVCGTGPYKMEEWVADSYVKLVRNENYWNGTPYFDEVLLQIIPDASARNMALESGDIDICLEPSLAQIDAIEANEDLVVFSAPTSNNYTLFLNNQVAPFDDLNVRRACALALNYDGNVKAAVGEKYGYAINSMLPKTNKYYVDPAKAGYTNYFHYDVEEAKKLMAASKYAGKKLTVELSYAEGATWQAYATLIQQQWAELGIEVTLAPMATSAFYDYIAAGKHQAEMINNSSPDPQAQYQFYDHRISFKAARGGAGCAEIPGFDALIDGAKATTNEQERCDMYAQLQKMLDEYVPSIPLYVPTKVCLTRKGVEGIILTTVGDINASKAYMK